MTTHTREIAMDEWRFFFDNASRHYQGREVKIELLGPDLGVHVLSQRLPLMGITVEENPGGGGAEIQIMTGDPEKGNVTHVISAPRHVWIEQEINGGDNAIEIESAGNAIIIELSAERNSDVSRPCAEQFQ